MKGEQTELAKFLRASKVQNDYTLIPIRSGRNSQAYRVHVSSRDWFLKKYHHDSKDKRDRLGIEFHFLQFLWKRRIRQIPEPISCNTDHHFGLYSFISGSHPKEIESSHISQAIQFLCRINQFREAARINELASASEACFSMREHIYSAERRLMNLIQMKDDSNIAKEARRFVEKKLLQKWDSTIKVINKAVLNYNFEQSIPQEERILSPSDFGFHNILENERGDLSFVDFEYAGWDDPAKLVCDFACQPEIPVSEKLWLQFLEGMSEMLGASSMYHRVKVLLPIYRLKWCCIMLNEFQSIDFQRRKHAGKDMNHLLDIQLTKAQDYFNQYVRGEVWLT